MRSTKTSFHNELTKYLMKDGKELIKYITKALKNSKVKITRQIKKTLEEIIENGNGYTTTLTNIDWEFNLEGAGKVLIEIEKGQNEYVKIVYPGYPNIKGIIISGEWKEMKNNKKYSSFEYTAWIPLTYCLYKGTLVFSKRPLFFRRTPYSLELTTDKIITDRTYFEPGDVVMLGDWGYAIIRDGKVHKIWYASDQKIIEAIDTVIVLAPNRLHEQFAKIYSSNRPRISYSS